VGDEFSDKADRIECLFLNIRCMPSTGHRANGALRETTTASQ
jgi:hypothetical protein